MLCPCCDREPESISPALIKSDIAKRVRSCWEDCLVNLLMNYWDVSDTALEILASGTSTDLESFFRSAWSIWYNRNLVVFESTCQLPHQIWKFAMGYLKNYKENRRAPYQYRTTGSRKWEAPPNGVFKVNVDGVTSDQGRNSCVGVVIRRLSQPGQRTLLAYSQ
uniref:Uncharacterized protein n=1 Tax=Quercus lobata TaxID=97700 RepID=A0A7N2LMT2_QUELO